MVKLSVNVTEDVAEAIRELAGEAGSATEVVRRAISAYKFICDERKAGNPLFIQREGDFSEIVFL